MEQEAIMPTKPENKEEPTLVMKFGGTSVGTVAAMSRVVDIVQKTHPIWPRLVVVTSALSGVTDLLLDSARKAARGDLQTLSEADSQLRAVHYEIISTLVLNTNRCLNVKRDVDTLIAGFINLVKAIAVLGETTPRALDAVAALGERLSVRVLAATLEDSGIPSTFVEATQLIQTDSHHQSAHPLLEPTTRKTRQVLYPILEAGRVPVVTGFIGADSEGIITTLGRGGSDYSAALLGATLPAKEVWIWTDVNGVMSADPRLVEQARTIPNLTYREIAELAYFGAKVVHPKTILPIVEAGIDLRICNTFNPDQVGTRLETGSSSTADGRVKAVTAIRGQRLLTVEGRGMLGVPGVAARTFAAVASTGTSVALITQASSEQSICFALPAESSDRVITALEKTFALELANRDIDRIWATDEVVIITAVGAGMKSTPGVAGEIFTCLGERDVNVIAIAQGSSDVSISLVVEAGDAEAAVSALHDLILNGKKPTKVLPQGISMKPAAMKGTEDG
jgi:bifunctional aspartokinase / homoserine dehydrogenase 1